MEIVYYLVIYYKSKTNQKDIEIALKPFSTEKKAEEYMAKHTKTISNRMVHWKIKKVNLSKFEKGYWL